MNMYKHILFAKVIIKYKLIVNSFEAWVIKNLYLACHMRVHYTVYNVHCTLYTTYTIRRILYSAQRTLYITQDVRTLHGVHCTCCK